jgi:hypothetical protein
MASLAVVCAQAQDRAVLRKVSDTQYRVDVTINAPLSSGGVVTAALYSVDGGRRKQLSRFAGPLPPQPDPAQTTFSIDLPRKPADDESLVVAVFEFPSGGDTLSYDLPVVKLLATSLASTSRQCPGGLRLRLVSRDYTEQDWDKLRDYFDGYRKNPELLATVTVLNGTVNSRRRVESVRVETPTAVAVSAGQMNVCLKVAGQLPDSTFKATVEFNNPPTTDLASVVQPGLDGAPAPPVPTLADDNGVPGTRGTERNLDLGISFNTSVAEVEQPDKTKVPERTSRGTFDVRLAPWLNIEPYQRFDPGQKWFRYFTPIYLDAAVSTGKIDEDTLSMNRVLFGADHEWRYYDFKTDADGNNVRTPYTTFHRLILKGQHASDRDFKQLEYLATFEWQPVLGKLNHPLYKNWKFEGDLRVPADFGYEIRPRFGATLGRTYARRDPAEAITVSPTARRFHVGLDMIFNLTRYVTLSVSDTFWLRGEADDDRFHNHFKGGVEAPLGRPFKNSVHSMFLSFERGNEPPFATRDVNVFKIGYRVRSDGWFGYFR